MVAVLFGCPGTALSVLDMAAVLWPHADGGPESWRKGLDVLAFYCRARLAPFGLTIGRPLSGFMLSAELPSPALARAA